MPPVEVALLHLELGDAVAQQPADAVGALEHDDRRGRPGSAAGRRRARPGRSRPPRRVLPVGAAGGCGVTQPSAQARSMISTSTCLIVTGSWLMPSTQAASHGAGHSRPVNSGKLLVACSRSIAVAPVVAVDQVVPLGDEVARAGSRCGRTGCRSPCSGWPARCSVLAAGTARRPRASRGSARRPGAASGVSRPCCQEAAWGQPWVASITALAADASRAAALGRGLAPIAARACSRGA